MTPASPATAAAGLTAPLAAPSASQPLSSPLPSPPATPHVSGAAASATPSAAAAAAAVASSPVRSTPPQPLGGGGGGGSSGPADAAAATPLQPKSLSTSSGFQRRFAAGGGAGVITKLATAPLERAKVLMQVQGMMGYVGGRAKYATVYSTLARVVKEEGAHALYRGCGANIIRIAPAYAFKFSLNDQFKRVVRRPNQRSARDLSLGQLISAATAAGAVQTFITYPLESIRQRLYMANSLGHNFTESGIPNCVRRTMQAEGVRGFYKGLGVGLATGAPFVGVEMSMYEVLVRNIPQDTTGVMRVPWHFAFGSMAGVFTQTVLYPLDTLWRRVMSDGVFDRPRRYTSSLDCISVTLKEEGVRGMFAGVGANAVRAIPAAGIQFMAYEFLKSCFHVT
eukprot:Rhum_TRINITY_DN13048_c5_g1::Rhum_TRINITY_DN13048_c5_g1_i1::g.56659::m.56659/K14684/SLC25A23S; solute carrier family 25 (mitochondrial phosphate transporter), member 23/24/25/41